MKASGGLDEKEGVTWYRPIPPPGYAVAGDVVRPYLAASPRFYLEAPVFAIGPFPLEAAQRTHPRLFFISIIIISFHFSVLFFKYKSNFHFVQGQAQ
jgi:hypothetical protein